MASKGSAKAPAAAPVIEYFGFMENGLQTQDSFRLSQKAFADCLVRAAIAKADYNVAIPTPSGMALELFVKTLCLSCETDKMFSARRSTTGCHYGWWKIDPGFCGAYFFSKRFLYAPRYRAMDGPVSAGVRLHRRDKTVTG